MPAAIATTFLSAPAISQPTTSGFVYTRNARPMNTRWSTAAVSASPIAMTDAVGCPSATSRARLGPVSTPMRSGVVGAEHVADDLGHSQVGALLDALREADDRRVVADDTRSVGEDGAKAVRRHTHDEDVGAATRGLEVGGRVQAVGEHDAREVPIVLVGGVDARGELGFAGPEHDVDVLGEDRSDGGPPRPGADDRSGGHGAAASCRTAGLSTAVSGVRTHHASSPGPGCCG